MMGSDTHRWKRREEERRERAWAAFKHLLLNGTNIDLALVAIQRTFGFSSLVYVEDRITEIVKENSVDRTTDPTDRRATGDTREG